MCGIAGIFHSTEQRPPELKDSCLSMLKRLEHRGPDASGLFQDQNIVLGHQRLSVIDLSDAANQPISNEDGTIWLSFNGEIYNFRELRDELIRAGHRFKSKSDSEVIVHLYEAHGSDCLQRLEGMFAFALWDAKKKRLFLARDRFGIKPLYYADTPSGFVFASEASALVASGLVSNTIDPQAVTTFLQQGSVAGPRTMYQEVKPFPAGHYLLKDGSGGGPKPYWSLSDCFLSRGAYREAPPANDFRSIMRAVVKRHLTSDVPLAVLLSGGMDSTSLVALAREVSDRELNSLTVRFEDDVHDESPYARIVGERFHTKQHECTVTPTDFKRDLENFIRALDQPTVDGFNTFVVSRAARDQGFRVLLSGLGGDEVFGGYPHFKRVTGLFRFVSVLGHAPVPVRKMLLRWLAAAARQKGLKGAERFQYLANPSRRNAYLVYRGLFAPDLLEDVTGFPSQTQEQGDEHLDALTSELDKALYLEFGSYLHDQLLRDTDIASMHHSIEMRVPFLDHELVSAVFRLPARQRFHARHVKILLRDTLGDVLPAEILHRPKRGFIFPMGTWMKGELRNEVESVLLDGDSSHSISFLKQKGVEKVWKGFLGGSLHWSLPWSLYMLKRWNDKKKQGSVTLKEQAELVSHGGDGS
jgi:asparagine synthase (glutamine-hydrolysing)